MIQNLDWDLTSEEPTVLGPEEYAKDIQPKLAILHQIAVENARDSAERQRNRVNKGAKPPKYAKGDKLLLSNSVVKPGESSKLTQKYTGVYEIKDVRPGFNYMLTDPSTC